MTSVDEELSNKVFSNPYLMENILSHVTDEIVRNFEMRLTSKAFNNGCLAVVRAKFRVLSIVFEEKSNGYRGLTNEFVHLIVYEVEISKISPCFLFLKNILRLKVEELEVKEIWKLEKTLRKQFHDSIHSDLIGDNHKSIRKLTGLEEACFGCSKCLKFIEHVQEYGPLRFRSLKVIKKPISIRRLIVNDLLLEQIANVCVKDSSTKEECYRKLNSMINVPIQCDTLIFWISESRKLSRLDENETHQYMPREVFELILG
uniref:Uncharacterized protein n=1 Tax=Caenorhabditis tropicalis TaxID=1561998 RepID=A0A1I7UX29_9PELO